MTTSKLSAPTDSGQVHLPLRPEAAPHWMFWVLMIAAVYNLAWGTFVIVAPALPFQWAGLAVPNYLSLWQCIGMIVGVYGVGYAIAAYNPGVHWPIVLVGLLGKIFGPIGFVYTAWRGELPWIAGLTNITNDLIWWLPFAAILVYAVSYQDRLKALANGQSLQEVLAEAKSASGVSLLEASAGQKLLVVFIRHSGCTFCLEALDQLSKKRPELQQADCHLAIVHMGSPRSAEKMAKKFALEDALWIADPERKLYRAFDLRLGTLSQLFGGYVWWRAFIGGSYFRYGSGPMEGNGLQMPGTFLLKNGEILQGFRHQTAADVPDYTGLACSV